MNKYTEELFFNLRGGFFHQFPDGTLENLKSFCENRVELNHPKLIENFELWMLAFGE